MLRRDGVRGAGADRRAGTASAASPISTARGSSASPGRPASAPRPNIPASSPPRTCRPFIRSWPPSRRRPSTTSPTAASRSTWSPAGTGPRSRCSASPLMPHDDRYDMRGGMARHHPAAVDARTRTSTSRASFYKIKKGFLQPKPIQKPFPAVMNAGGSDKGQHFAAKYCDMVYVVFGSHDFDDCKAQGRIRIAISRARNTAARSRSGATPTWCRARPRRRRKPTSTNTSTRRATGTAAENLVNTMIANAKTLPPEVLRRDEEALHRRLGRLSDRRHARSRSSTAL